MEFIELPTDLMQKITPEQAWHYKIIPKVWDIHNLSFYSDDTNEFKSEELEVLFGKSIQLIRESPEVVNKTLNKYYRIQEHRKSKQLSELKSSDDFLIRLIEEARELNSSDIHIEPYEETCRVRIRIDGQLIERYQLNKIEYPGIINKIKIKANLDIAEKRLPQDGRIYFEHGNQKFDIRVSILPTLYGEKVVMRLLSNDATEIDLAQLGFAERDLSLYLEGVRKTQGIVLISGPTGSGKTTTLYATLKLLNKETKNILTIEDPIEYTLSGINQVQLRENIGLNFSKALRTFLRQDPDIIMVGEIRDYDTAEMAIRAALTGHLVLSTIHTNSAWGTISRLIDMGVPSFLVANTLNLSVAQRLVRLLCTHCKEKQTVNTSTFHNEHLKNITESYMAVGCEHCFFTGYKGRKAIYEVINVDKDFAEAVKNQVFNVDQLLEEKKIISLQKNAVALVESGATSIEEIYPILLNN